MRPVSGIWVVYDSTCGLCSSVKDWIGRQTALVRVEFLTLECAEVKKRFPQLPAGELAVVANTGEVWLGNHAWIVCLWALRDYRDWAVRLSSPLLTVMAREAFVMVSRNRHGLSGLLRLKSDQEVEQQLRKIMVATCETRRK